MAEMMTTMLAAMQENICKKLDEYMVGDEVSPKDDATSNHATNDCDVPLFQTRHPNYKQHMTWSTNISTRYSPPKYPGNTEHISQTKSFRLLRKQGQPLMTS